eukprot:CAMPEP_0168624742 /NCGR_PEP_ID=MMETSP0449_2-20121227/9597_1 /TAXON_ID=1082188 /ORGANISM="Strombidium rassoulzadegani, Strain ras09" /LENGTH=118 /DNA_ID=CAMNT_0008666363 /DNA_START=763 /DNA_END=1116 /DNA_ORIENTATION=+
MLKEIHFSVIIFHYTALASLILIVWILLDHFTQLTGSLEGVASIEGVGAEPTWSNIRLFNYTWSQYNLMIVLSLFNAVGMNFNTLAFQYEKQSAFISLVGYMNVPYAFLVDIFLFGQS